MQSVILHTLTECGYQARAVPYSHVKEIHETINSLYQEGSLAQGVYDEVMEYVSFDPPKEMPEPKSIIILAIGNPPNLNLTFQWKGGEVKTCLPGVYRKAFKSRETIWQEVGDTLAKYGYRWARAPLPHKTLAVRSGLAAIRQE